MIGFDFPIMPGWVHDVLALWQSNQPMNVLLQAALDRTMHELGGVKTRKNTLSIIVRNFVPTTGAITTRRTLEHNVWASYSHRYGAGTLAPAYLARLVMSNEVAQTAVQFIRRRCRPGESLQSGELRMQIISRYGERKVVTNAVSAVLRTLQYFGVLAESERQGMYRFIGPLDVPHDVFPLMVWGWWQAHPTPQIDLDAFDQDASLALVNLANMVDCWRAFQPALWVLSERLDARQAVLRDAEMTTFEKAMIGQVAA